MVKAALSVETGRARRLLVSGAIKANGRSELRSVFATISAEKRTFATLSLSLVSGETGRWGSSAASVRSRRDLERERALPCRDGRSLITGRDSRSSSSSSPSSSLSTSSMDSEAPCPFPLVWPLGVAN